MSASEAKPNPRVGVAAIIQREDGRIVVGGRMASHGDGTRQLPGGHLEFGESFFDCAERETLEETGLVVKGTDVVHVTNDVYDDLNKHYITIFIKCVQEDPKAMPENMEPEKCSGWELMTWDELRAIHSSKEETAVRLFKPLGQLVDEVPNIESMLAIDSE